MSDRGPRPERDRDQAPDYSGRALALWPRLDTTRLARVRHDARRTASLIARRTNLPSEAILALLAEPLAR